MQNDEGKRLDLFIQRVCKLQKKKFAEEVGKSPADISKYVAGSTQVPYDVLKYMYKKWQLRYTWFFEGTGAMTAGQTDNKKLMSNLTDILASVSYTEQAIDSLRIEFKKLAAELYAIKHGV